MARERFRKLFPHLAEEMDSGRSRIRVADVEEGPSITEKGPQRKWASYDPDATDFIRRCSTEEEAEEIIAYLEERGEITHERASELRSQLHKNGLESFGSRKDVGFYHRNL
jgi:hypothetical protein